MADFSQFKAACKQADTAIYTFHELEGAPWIRCRRADESNKAYFNALLKSQRSRRRQLRTGNIKAEDLKAARNEDRKLYPKYIITEWCVKDKNGKDVELNEEDCRKFLEAIPDWSFDDCRDFAAMPQSFDIDASDSDDTEGTGKN